MSFICSFKMDVAILNLKKKEDRLSKNDLPTCPQLDSGEGSKDSNLFPGILTRYELNFGLSKIYI